MFDYQKTLWKHKNYIYWFDFTHIYVIHNKKLHFLLIFSILKNKKYYILANFAFARENNKFSQNFLRAYITHNANRGCRLKYIYLSPPLIIMIPIFLSIFLQASQLVGRAFILAQKKLTKRTLTEPKKTRNLVNLFIGFRKQLARLKVQIPI